MRLLCVVCDGVLLQMPLGKLSKAHIQKGYDVLTTIQSLIQQEEAGDGNGEGAFIAASNQLYSLIPRSFGNKAPPIVRTTEQLKVELEMVESLLEMSEAMSMLKQEKSEEEESKRSRVEAVSPIDQHYRKLNTELRPLDASSERYQLVSAYLQNTHAATHSQYKLELLDCFELVREGEVERFQQHAKDPNRMLLWHGSRTTNFAGILSQGLRIAPPEAPATGYMSAPHTLPLHPLSVAMRLVAHSSH